MKNIQLVRHPVQLRDVVVEKIECNRYEHSHDLQSHEVELNIKPSTHAKIIDSNTAIAYLTIEIETKSEPKVLEIKVNLRGTCTTDDKDEERLKEFTEVNALPLLLPWAREIISNLTVKMGFPPIMLPTINVRKTLEANHQEVAVTSEE